MKKYYFFAFASVLILSCSSSEQPQLFNHYKTHSVSTGERIKNLFRGITCYISGSELYLNQNSTFHYTTCGNVMTGTWKRVDDEVWLTASTNTYRIDSLNETWPKLGIGTSAMIYKIEPSSLTKVERDESSKSIEILYKSD